MFGFSKKDIQLEKLRLRNDVLDAENTMLSNVIKEYDNKIDKQNRDAEVVIDWKNLNAFSIERLKEITIIGYFLKFTDENGKHTHVKEWRLHCSIERHNELVEQFKQYIKV